MVSRNRRHNSEEKRTIFIARTGLFLFLIAMMLLWSTAFAEEFMLRNGIKFLDSMSDVILKEPLGMRSVDIPDDELYDAEPEYGVNPYTEITNKGEIAGIDGSHIEYHFDSNRQLKMALYIFPDMPALLDDIQVDFFNSINDALMSKYGEPRSQNPDDVFILKSLIYNAASILTSMSSWTGGYGVFDNYAEWIVDCGEYKVKIEHIEYCEGKSFSEAKSYHVLTYFYFTDADVAAAEQEKLDKLNDAASDL